MSTTLPAPDPRPVISQRQASFATAAIAAQAMQEATREGIDPVAMEALLQQPVTIGGITFEPVSLQTLMAIQLLNKRRARLGAAASPLRSGTPSTDAGGHVGEAGGAETPEEGEDLFSLAEGVFAFAEPLVAARMLLSHTPAGEWEDEICHFAARLRPAHLREMGEHIRLQMEQLHQLGGEAGDAQPAHPHLGAAS